MATNKRQFTLRMNERIFEGIKMIAEKERRSMAVMIELIIESYIFEYDKFTDSERKRFFSKLEGLE